MSSPRDKVTTLEKIIKAAEKEFSLKGVDAANIENIARSAGVTKQLVYHYFKTKHQLYEATLDSVSQSMQILADRGAYQNLRPDEAIRHLVHVIINEFVEHPSYAAFTLDQALHQGEHISASSRFIPTMRIFIAEVVEPIFERGIGEGVFKPNLNVKATFWMIFHLTTACFLNGKIMSEISDADFSSLVGIEKWRDETIDFILSAICVVE